MVAGVLGRYWHIADGCGQAWWLARPATWHGSHPFAIWPDQLAMLVLHVLKLTAIQRMVAAWCTRSRPTRKKH